MFDLHIFQIFAIAVLFLYLFGNVILPKRYYRFEHKFRVRSNAEIVRNNLCPFSENYQSSLTNISVLNGIETDNDRKLIQNSKGTKALIERLPTANPMAYRFKSLSYPQAAPVFGKDHFEEWLVEPVDDETSDITLSSNLGYANPLDGKFLSPDFCRRYCDALKQALESGEPMRAVPSRRLSFNLAMFVLSIAAVSLLFRLPVAIVIMVGILLHELGHALALKLIKEKVLDISFVPFLGAATEGTPPKTAFKQAFFAMGGSLFSGLVIATIAVGISVLGVAEFEAHGIAVWPRNLAGEIVLGLFVVACLNLFQLLPLGLLDGGQTLFAMLSGLSQKSRAILLGTIALVVTGLSFQWLGMITGIVALVMSLVTVLTLFIRDSDIEFERATIKSGLGIAGLYLATILVCVVTLGATVSPTLALLELNDASAETATEYDLFSLRSSIDFGEDEANHTLWDELMMDMARQGETTRVIQVSFEATDGD